jgi:hypothetical protein
MLRQYSSVSALRPAKTLYRRQHGLGRLQCILGGAHHTAVWRKAVVGLSQLGQQVGRYVFSFPGAGVIVRAVPPSVGHRPLHHTPHSGLPSRHEADWSNTRRWGSSNPCSAYRVSETSRSSSKKPHSMTCTYATSVKLPYSNTQLLFFLLTHQINLNR